MLHTRRGVLLAQTSLPFPDMGVLHSPQGCGYTLSGLASWGITATSVFKLKKKMFFCYSCLKLTFLVTTTPPQL